MRRLPRSLLETSVAPEPLGGVLDALVDAGILAGYEERGGAVCIWGDLTAVEAALQRHAPATQEHQSSPRAEYFSACRQFLFTRSFRGLPKANQAIWRMHANGASHREICFKLRVSPMKVRMAVRGARLAAALPPVTSSMPRGGGPGRPPMPPEKRPGCAEEQCDKTAEARGYCNVHYQRRRRRRAI